MQGLDPARENLRETGVGGKFHHRHCVFAQKLGRASSGEQFDPQRGKALGEGQQAGLVGNGEEGAGNFHREGPMKNGPGLLPNGDYDNFEIAGRGSLGI